MHRETINMSFFNPKHIRIIESKMLSFPFLNLQLDILIGKLLVSKIKLTTAYNLMEYILKIKIKMRDMVVALLS